MQDRWTYKLQELLGQNFDVIEEGLRSRTTNIEDPKLPNRNGFAYFRVCFESIEPDFLIYMLGTNDTKTRFNRDANSILAGIAETIDWMDSFNKQRKAFTKVILVAPPQINVQYLETSSQFDGTSNEKLIQLASKLEGFAKQRNLLFIDLSKDIVGAENDGIHLKIEDNKEIAKRISNLMLNK